MPKKISDIVQYHRFDYNHNKEINDVVNSIINKLNEYEKLDKYKKDSLIKKFFKEEIMSRRLPYPFSIDLKTITMLIATDFIVFNEMIDAEEAKTLNIDGEEVLDYISLLNLIMDKYPEMASNATFRKNNMYCLEQIISTPKLYKLLLGYAKNTLERFKTNEKRLVK